LETGDWRSRLEIGPSASLRHAPSFSRFNRDSEGQAGHRAQEPKPDTALILDQRFPYFTECFNHGAHGDCTANTATFLI
jgi:hypothetical protein